jgi:hypothetical protein
LGGERTMKGLVKKRITFWLSIVMLILSSFSGFNSSKVVYAEDASVQTQTSPTISKSLDSKEIKQQIMSNLPFDLKATDGANQLETQQLQAAPQASATLTFPQTMDDWILDKAAGKIYAISSSANKLYFLNKQTLTIESEILLSGSPKDMDQHGDNLYIALQNKIIQVVNVNSRSLTEQYPTSVSPIEVTASDTHIYYGTSTQHSDIRSIEKATKLDTMFWGSMYNVDLQMAEDNRTLYAAERSSSGSELVAFDTAQKIIIDSDNYSNNYGFPSPSGEMILDEKSVLYAGYRINKSNLREIQGEYQWLGDPNYYAFSKLLAASSNYVLSKQVIFDKNLFVPLATLPFEPTLGLIEEDGSVILFQSSTLAANNKIYRYTLPLQSPTVQLEKTQNKLTSNYKMTDWATNEDIPYIYLISDNANSLTVIRKSDLSTVKSVYIGSRPNDIEINNGKVYIALKGETRIAQFDIANTEKADMDVQKRSVMRLPYKVQPYNNKIFYTGDGSYGAIDVLSDTENRTVIRNSAYYYMDSHTGILYISTGRAYQKIDPATYSIIQQEANNNAVFYDPDSFFVDGNFMYNDGERVNATDLKTSYGTYAEKVIYAKDNLVFGNRAVYDRDSFRKIADLPYTISKAYVGDNGTIFITADNKMLKYSNIEELASQGILPYYSLFIDTDIREGYVTGVLAIVPSENNSSIRSYNAYFVDYYGNKQQRLDMTLESQENGVLIYEFSYIYQTPSSSYTTIGIYPVLQDGTEHNQFLSSEIWDMPTYLAKNVAISNTQFDETGFSGTISWNRATRQPPTAVYQVYFIDHDGILGEPIHSAPQGNVSYSVNLKNVPIPYGAIGMAVILQKSNGEESPYYSTAIFEELLSPMPVLENISITNNQSSNDTVTVTGLTPGDIIRVYNEAESTTLGEGTVAANQTSVTISIPEIGAPGQKVSVTRETVELYESVGTLVVIPNTVTPPTPPPVVTPPPVTPPPVNPPGGSVPPPATPTKPATPAPKLEEKEQDQNGKKVTVAEVNEDYIKYFSEQSDFSFSKTIVLKMEKPEGNAQFKLTEKAVTFLSDKDNDASIEVQTAFGKIKLPVAPIVKEVNSKSGDQTITLAVEQASADYTTKLKSQLKGATLIGKPVEFKVLSNGTELQNFNQYLEHVLTIDTSNVSVSELVGLTYDTASRTYVPVPAKFEWSNGVLTASLYRKGNSVYTVVKNKVTLKDLPKTTEYKNSIQKLANRTVISGFKDGTFKPEQSVTRAEFAKMLNRALGIQAITSTKSQFKDVQSKNWFHGDVAASVKAGLIKGFADGTFRPNQKITHKEMIVMLNNALNYAGAEKNQDVTLTPPADVPSWAKAAYKELVAKSMIENEQDVFSFKANKATTRKESALLIYRLLVAIDYIN